MTRLTNLNVSDNKLEDLPLSIGYCKDLAKPQAKLNIDKNKIKSEKLQKKWETEPQNLMEYLMKRLEGGFFFFFSIRDSLFFWLNKAAHYIPDVASMKKIKPPVLTASKEELAYKQHKFVDDIATNPEMATKVTKKKKKNKLE